MSIDYEKNRIADIPDKKLADVIQLANELLRWREILREREVSVISARKRLERIEGWELPELMTELGLSSFTLSDGKTVSIKSIIKASIPTQNAINRLPVADRPKIEQQVKDAIQWLQDHNADAIVKNQLMLNFGKGSQQEMDDVKTMVQETGSCDIQEQHTIHPSTLTAYIKEQMANGVTIPMDLFRVYTGQKAVIK